MPPFMRIRIRILTLIRIRIRSEAIYLSAKTCSTDSGESAIGLHLNVYMNVKLARK